MSAVTSKDLLAMAELVRYDYPMVAEHLRLLAKQVTAPEPRALQIERDQLALRVKTLECERDAWRGSSNAFKAEAERAAKERESLAVRVDVIYDGHRVFKALDERAQKRTSAENVSDVLDAVVRIWRVAEDRT